MSYQDIGGEEVGASKDNHHDADGEESRADALDQAWSVGLEPRRGIGRQCKSASKSQKRPSQERVEEHLVDTHPSLRRPDSGDKLGGLCRREGVHIRRR